MEPNTVFNVDNNEENKKDRIILEGMTSVSACIGALDCGRPSREIYEVLADSSKLRGNSRFVRRLSYLRAMSAKHGFALKMCEPEELDVLTSSKTHGGIAAHVGPRHILPLSDAKLPSRGFFMLFDGIEDPYSFGYSLRSLYAAGADGVVIPGGHFISAEGIIARSSAGAYEHMPIYSAASGSAEAVLRFKSAGYRALCSEIRNSTDHTKACLDRPILLVMGGEKRGISASLSAMCDGNVRIAYGREFMGSLSTACAVSVLAFAVPTDSQPSDQ